MTRHSRYKDALVPSLELESSPTAGSFSSGMAPLPDAVMTASQPYVGRWNRLVSTTNWEKGRIIGQWREALEASGATASTFSDEAWAVLVGGVTGQHVGRLRRVAQRFGQSHEKFQGLFWSHFQAALDWTDAEMWLEGAVQSGWTVARMRHQRWETLGRVESERPHAGDIVPSETDEDFEPARNEPPTTGEMEGKYGVVSGPAHEGPDFGDDEAGGSSAGSTSSTADDAYGDESEGASQPTVTLVSPFQNMPELPADLADAFDSFKLALLHHKREGWQEISLTNVLRVLDGLKALAEAPSDEQAPF